jgi:hypothetical protein
LLNTNETSPQSPSFTQTIEFDNALAELDLDSINEHSSRTKLLKMIIDVYINTIKLPIIEFHRVVTQRDELVRIKRVTTTSILESTAAKVAAVLHAERPAERPVLSGLIREETEKSTLILKRKLQSAMDQLDQNKKQLKLLSSKISSRRTPEHPHTLISKNTQGSNMTWSRAILSNEGDSPVAAATLPTTQHSPPMQPTITPLPMQPTSRPEPRQALQAAADNASAARRRRRNKQRLLRKSLGSSNSSTRK